MIIVNCDKCDHEFEVSDAQAGAKVACPECGDINRVPQAASAGRSGGAAAAPPVGQSRKSSGPEHEVCVVRTAMFRAHPFWYALALLLFFGGLLLAVEARRSEALADWLVWAGLAVAAGAFLWWLIWWAAPHRWVKLIITTKRTIRQEGIIIRKTSEVLHNHIQNVKIQQSLLQRLLNVGTLEIDSAGGSSTGDSIEIRMTKVPRPYQVKSVIDEYRDL